MVVPISGSQNYLPLDRGKRISGRESEKVSFGEYLLEKVEPFEESYHSGQQNKGSPEQKTAKDSGLTGEITAEEPQGGGVERNSMPAGRRIDLRA